MPRTGGAPERAGESIARAFQVRLLEPPTAKSLRRANPLLDSASLEQSSDLSLRGFKLVCALNKVITQDRIPAVA